MLGYRPDEFRVLAFDLEHTNFFWFTAFVFDMSKIYLFISLIALSTLPAFLSAMAM